MGEEVPAKEAGDLTAAALATPGLITPVARLKLLQGAGAMFCARWCGHGLQAQCAATHPLYSIMQNAGLSFALYFDS